MLRIIPNDAGRRLAGFRLDPLHAPVFPHAYAAAGDSVLPTAHVDGALHGGQQRGAIREAVGDRRVLRIHAANLLLS